MSVGKFTFALAFSLPFWLIFIRSGAAFRLKLAYWLCEWRWPKGVHNGLSRVSRVTYPFFIRIFAINTTHIVD